MRRTPKARPDTSGWPTLDGCGVNVAPATMWPGQPPSGWPRSASRLLRLPRWGSGAIAHGNGRRAFRDMATGQLRRTFADSTRSSRRADVGQDAPDARGSAGDADRSPVQDESEVERFPFGRGDQSVELVLDLDRVVELREAETLAQPQDVRVDRETGQTECGTADDVARLAPYPGTVTRSSKSVGTSPPKRSSSAAAIPMRLRALARKKPVEWMISSSSSGWPGTTRPGPGTWRRGRASPCSPGRPCSGPTRSSPPATGKVSRARARTVL